MLAVLRRYRNADLLKHGVDMVQFILNRALIGTAVSPGTVTLDLLREEQGLKGTKEGCREGDCGACTILVGARLPHGMEYRSAASCLLPVGDLHGKHVVTIEGLNIDGLTAVQQALVDEGATQCGFCTPGIVVALTGFLLTSASLGLEDAYAAVEGNICRCTGYISIRRAAEQLLKKINIASVDVIDRIPELVKTALLPRYFLDIPARLDAIGADESRRSATKAAVPVAGGTDLFVQRPDHLCTCDLHFLGGDHDLCGIRLESGNIVVGAATTVEELKGSTLFHDTFPTWEEALRLVSSTLIRNRATLAGNIVNASPIGDLTILLLALDARLTIQGKDRERHIPLDSFYRGYKEFDLTEGELITTVTIPLPPPGSLFNFEKVSRREYLDIAGVNTAMLVEKNGERISKARISAGGVGPIPMLLARSSAWLSERVVSPAMVDELTQIADTEIAPISDVRGTADYKRRLLRRLITAHFVTCFPDLAWEELFT